ncbi:hypothetical protein JB92DRAFT_2885738 [Gautieria morchelliformis]|nr:hypothetical protein JB92DRAFT_2885738 [Gautieria morchelliformis]
MSTSKSPPLSPLTIGSSRSLSPRRRGSVAAPDPFGTFPDTARTMTSTLHIIKAPSHSVNQGTDEWAKRQSRSRAGSHSGGTTGTRISFAFSGFSQASPQRETMSAPWSTISEPSRSVSPLNTRFARSNSFTNLSTTPHTPLTPVQVYDFAQQCNHPQSRPSSPVMNTSMPASPVNFTPLPEAFRLPFLDRPKEVKSLLCQPLTAKLFLFLAQTFPVKTSSGGDSDPSSWTYSQLEHWLTQTSREEVGDIEWVQNARLCISARSELIWERVKAALGVPPELDSLDKIADKQNGSTHDMAVTEVRLDGEDVSEAFGDAWVEPIVSGPVGPSPIPPPRSPTASFPRSPKLGHQGVGRMEDISEDISEPIVSTPVGPSPIPPPRSPTALFPRSPKLGHQVVGRMEDISEDVSESGARPAATAAVHGLRVVVPPSEPPVRHYSSFSASDAGPSSRPHVPYDVVAERGPGHPLFPSSFANLALGPTLHANNPSIRFPSAPPPSAYSPSHSTSHSRRQVASWAEGWDPHKQEYALSVASERSRRSLPVE